MRLPVFYILFLTTLLALGGCYDELPEEQFLATASPIRDTGWLRNADGSAALDRTIVLDTLLRPGATNFTFDPQVADTLRGSGWSLAYPANAFTLASAGSQGPAVSSPVTLSVQTGFAKGALLRQAISTVVQGQRVQAFGVFNLQAALGNAALVLRQGMELRLTTTTTGLPPIISLYQLNAGGNGPLTSVWQSPVDSSRLIFTQSGSPVFYTRRLGTVAGFLPSSSGGQVNVNAVLPLNFTNANTVVYALAPQQNSLVRLLPDAANKSFVLPNANTAETMRFVAISWQNNQFYYADQTISLAGNPLVRLTPSLITRQQLDAVVDAL